MPGLAAFDAPLDSAGIEDAEAQAPAALRAAGALERWAATDEGAIGLMVFPVLPHGTALGWGG